MFSSLIETQTSIYRLSIIDGEFVITKIAVKEGETSRLEVGEEMRGTELRINSAGCLLLGGKNTSPVVG